MGRLLVGYCFDLTVFKIHQYMRSDFQRSSDPSQMDHLARLESGNDKHWPHGLPQLHVPIMDTGEREKQRTRQRQILTPIPWIATQEREIWRDAYIMDCPLSATTTDPPVIYYWQQYNWPPGNCILSSLWRLQLPKFWPLPSKLWIPPTSFPEKLNQSSHNSIQSLRQNAGWWVWPDDGQK